MKMVKSLLLGSAAGIVAIAGAQAADLPVKAKPVEYVKVCSLYGAGYYYMPGTDICLKLGGYVRYQLNVGAGANISGGPQSGVGGFNTRRDDQDVLQRVRALITVDTRQQTAYGTLRSYLLIGYSHDTNGAAGLYVSRGFIQIAGFTFGKATSFFDIFPNASFAYSAGNNWSGDSGDGGVILMTYTAQFGNGFSGSLGIEQQRRIASAYFIGSAGAALSPLAIPGTLATANNLGGTTGNYPDVVGNLRLDQSWGTWIVAAALHNITGGYFGTSTALATEAFGHPGDEWGWAATTGFILNLPMITPGDRLSAQVVYSQGASAYHAANRSTANAVYFQGGEVAFGWLTDAVWGGNSVVNTFDLTTAWSVNAAFEHLWTPSLKTSWYGSYIDVSHNASSTVTQCFGQASNPAFTATCNPDWTAWTAVSRTEWEPVKGLTFGVDVIYQQINSASASAAGTVVMLQNGGKPAGTYITSDLGVWSGNFRVQRNFLP